MKVVEEGPLAARRPGLRAVRSFMNKGYGKETTPDPGATTTLGGSVGLEGWRFSLLCLIFQAGAFT